MVQYLAIIRIADSIQMSPNLGNSASGSCILVHADRMMSCGMSGNY